ncbi:putative AAA domain containing protein [Lyophyllum shimeji]|uniref:AAA domain containing protein n=1 Tax=Lyophyllum shimeji TaxID=47721 RepID=A0A9P3PLW7_LYOSH|nr:putative AAA domain containing protein [Lyophyllum shimeji]
MGTSLDRENIQHCPILAPAPRCTIPPRVTVEQVVKRNEYPPQRSTDPSVRVYFGTTYKVDCVIIDEAGQLGLSSVALVIRALSPTGRIIIAGDSEQLAPIMSAQYPQTKTRPLFGSILDCLMNTSLTPHARQPDDTFDTSQSSGSSQPSSNVVQLTENFPHKAQARQLARHLKLVQNVQGRDLGIQPQVPRDVQVFLLSRPKVMGHHRRELPEAHVRGEAAVAAAFVTSIQRCSSADDIFVATPHRVQRQAVKAALARVPPGEPELTVDTIERLQGSEAAFVICLFSVPKESVMSPDLSCVLERRRLNVAIRARMCFA